MATLDSVVHQRKRTKLSRGDLRRDKLERAGRAAQPRAVHKTCSIS